MRSTVASMALLRSSTTSTSSIGATSSARSTPVCPSQRPSGMTTTREGEFLPEGRFLAEGAGKPVPARADGAEHAR